MIMNHPAASSRRSRRQFLGWAAGAGLGVAALTACQAQQTAPTESAAATRTVTGVGGPMDVPATPSRVVASESISLGHLLALGVKPVAAAVNPNSLPTYQSELMSGVVDVLAGDGMNLEKALSTDPDLILTVYGARDEPDWNKKFYDQYKAAATTFGYISGYATIEEIEEGFTSVASAMGLQDKGKQVMDAYDQRVAALAARVKTAGLASKPVTTLRLSQDFYSLRIGSSESIAFRALGITQPPDQRDVKKFSIEISLEKLDVLDEADTLFVYTDDNADDDRKKWEASKLWQSLDVVRNKRVHFVNSGVWNSQDVVGLMRILDDIESAFIVPNGG